MDYGYNNPNSGYTLPGRITMNEMPYLYIKKAKTGRSGIIPINFFLHPVCPTFIRNNEQQ